MMVVKKSSQSKLAPIALIQKKVTPVRRKFPHDFFGAEGQSVVSPGGDRYG